MPKTKTHSGAKKRFSLTGTGKVKRKHAFKSHIYSFVDLGDNECKFHIGHVGEPGAGFCGLERIPQSAYCLGHHQRCWSPAPVRSRANAPVKQTENA